MLFIQFKRQNTGVKRGEINVHVGEKFSLGTEFNDVQLVQADGDELAHIIGTMSNVPWSSKKKVQAWTGDFAKFIALNW